MRGSATKLGDHVLSEVVCLFIIKKWELYIQEKRQKKKIYNTRDSHMVTHCSTNLAI